MNHNPVSLTPAHTAAAVSTLPASLEARLTHLFKAHPWMVPDALCVTADRILDGKGSYRTKLGQLYQLANKVNRSLKPYIACQKGCSHCCSMTTLIYRFEAVALAQASGRTMVDLPFRPHHQVIAAGRAAKPAQCPFVVAGCCSVYEHRPIICRLHHSLNSNPEDCRLTDARTPRNEVSMYDPDFLEMPYHHLVRAHHPKEPWGAITEFFPTQPVVSTPTPS